MRIALAAAALAAALALLLQAESPREKAARLFEQRDFAAAAAALEAHIEAQPDDHRSRLLLGVCYQLAGDNDRAEEVLRDAAGRRPRDGQTLFYYARILYLQGRLNDAARNARAAMEQGADRARCLHLKGLIEEETRDWDAALASYRAAIAADPKVFAEARVSAGVLLLKLGRTEEAAKELEAAAGIQPTLADAHYQLGRARLELGQPQQAEQALLRAVELTNHEQARLLIARLRSEGWRTRPAAAADSADRAPIRFREVAQQAGLDFVHRNHPTPEKHIIETMPGGVAVFDYDGDGLPDVFFTNGAAVPELEKNGRQYRNRLYRNLGGMRFAEVTDQAGLAGSGYAMGAAAGDFDNDGHVDLFVAGVNRNTLYRNLGNGRFEDATAGSGIAGDVWSVAAGWFDYDRDGLLDLFVVNYLQWSPAFARYCGDPASKLRVYCHPKHFEGLPNRLYRNLGGGRFEDVSDKAGIAAHTGKGMSVAFADYDEDGWPDVFVTNDTVPNFLFRNRGDSTFEEAALEAGVAMTADGKAVSAMGADFRDYDNDGLPDILFTALAGETFPLFRNLGGGLFQDFTYPAGAGLASASYSGWCVALADLNNNGWKDAFIATSHVTDNIEQFSRDRYKQPNRVWANRGGRFEDVSEAAGMRVARAHRGCAVADFNLDGRLDVVVTALGEPAELWENVGPGGNRWIAFRLVGVRSNRDAIGARIRLPGQTNAMTSAVGYASSVLGPVHFGVGDQAAVPRVEIVWPSGVVQELENLETGRVHTVREPGSGSTVP